MSIKMKVYSLISVRTQSRCLVVLLAVDVCAVVERLVPPPHWPSSFLILEVPVEAGERSVLLALVLQEQRTLIHTELLQVPATNTYQVRSTCLRQQQQKTSRPSMTEGFYMS